MFQSHAEKQLTRNDLPANPFYIDSDSVKEITQKLGLTVEEFLLQLVPIAQEFARPCISNYHVGAALLGISGSIYLGANLEFKGVPLNHTVHAEQFAVALARSNNEIGLLAIAIAAPPCGHCRQFIYEAVGDEDIQILVKGCSPQSLSEMLPNAFGPAGLGLSVTLLFPIDQNYAFTRDYSLRTLALMAAAYSYAPCSKAKSGIAVQTRDGHIFSGSYLETAAFNPSLSPLQVALISLVADLREYDEIISVLLVEQNDAHISHEYGTRELLKNIAPQSQVIKDTYAPIMPLIN